MESELVFCDVVLKRGICYFNMQDYDLATKDLTAVIQINAFFRDMAFHWRGKCEMKLGNWWKVVEDNTEALKINPNLYSAYKDRAEAYRALGKPELAQQDWQQLSVITRDMIWNN